MFVPYVLLMMVAISIHLVDGTPEVRDRCANLMSVALKIPIPPPNCGHKSSTNWIIAKTTKMKEPYPADFDKNQNTCSPQTYGPNCNGIHYIRVPQENGNGHSVHMYADHKTSRGNLLHLVDDFDSSDSEFQIHEGRVKSMEYVVDEKQLSTPVETIPEFVKNHHDNVVVVIHMSPDGRWLITRTCDLKHTWVALNWQYPKTDPPQAIWDNNKAKINEKLKFLGVDTSTMADLPLDSFTFNMFEAVIGSSSPTTDQAGTSGEVAGTSSGGGDASIIAEETRPEDAMARLKMKNPVIDTEPISKRRRRK